MDRLQRARRFRTVSGLRVSEGLKKQKGKIFQHNFASELVLKDVVDRQGSIQCSVQRPGHTGRKALATKKSPGAHLVLAQDIDWRFWMLQRALPWCFCSLLLLVESLSYSGPCTHQFDCFTDK